MPRISVIACSSSSLSPLARRDRAFFVKAAIGARYCRNAEARARRGRATFPHHPAKSHVPPPGIRLLGPGPQITREEVEDGHFCAIDEVVPGARSPVVSPWRLDGSHVTCCWPSASRPQAARLA